MFLDLLSNVVCSWESRSRSLLLLPIWETQPGGLNLYSLRQTFPYITFVLKDFFPKGKRGDTDVKFCVNSLCYVAEPHCVHSDCKRWWLGRFYDMFCTVSMLRGNVQSLAVRFSIFPSLTFVYSLRLDCYSVSVVSLLERMSINWCKQ